MLPYLVEFDATLYLLGACFLFVSRFKLYRSQSIWYFILVYLTARGVTSGGRFFKYDLVFFVVLVLFGTSIKKRSELELKTILTALINVLLIFSFLHLFIYGFHFEATGNEGFRNREILESTQKYLLWPITCVLFATKYLDRSSRKKALILFLMYLVSGVGYGSRNVVISAFPILIYLFLVSKNKVVMLAAVTLGLFGAFYSGSLDFIIYRLSATKLNQDLPRILEILDFWNSHALYHHILGKGFGGENNYWIFSQVEGGVNNMHIGYGYILLKGGFILLFLVFTQLFGFIRRSSQGTRASLFVLFLVLNEFSHTLLVRLPYVISVMLVVHIISINLQGFESSSTHN